MVFKNKLLKPIAASFVLVTLFILAGCASTGGGGKYAKAQQKPANEALLKAADNQAGLIELYKSRLISASSDSEKKDARLKLGYAYLATNDPESTLFTLEPLFVKNNRDAGVSLLQSKALLAMDKPAEALAAAEAVQDFSNLSPEALNLLGVIQADLGNYPLAREFFHKARIAMLDDLTVKNNLAMLDILEKDYSSAIKRLMPLYTSGQADERIKANLVLALVRAGLYNEFKNVYAGAKSEQERMSLFIALSSARPEAMTMPIHKPK